MKNHKTNLWYRRILLLILLVPVASLAKLTVYTHDSFSSKGSLGAWVSRELKNRQGIEIEFVTFGSAGEALNQVMVEGARTRADVLVGVDAALLERALKSGHFKKQNVAELKIPSKYLFDKSGQFVPYDYGYLAFLYNAGTAGTEIPKIKSLQELGSRADLKRKISLSDPRTSSIGFNLLLWTKSVFPDDKTYVEFWKGFFPKLLSIAPGWSGAYGLFLKGESSLVLSYTTSPAYHLEKERSHAIRALSFSEGHYRQIEGVGILANTKQTDAAQKFVEFLLDADTQAQIPLTQWMYPVREGIALPKSYDGLVNVTKIIEMDPAKIAANREAWLRDWARVASKP